MRVPEARNVRALLALLALIAALSSACGGTTPMPAPAKSAAKPTKLARRPKAGGGKLLGAHEGSVTAVAFSPDGATIASGGDDADVALWSVDGGKARCAMRHSFGVTAATFSADGASLITADAYLHVTGAGATDAAGELRVWRTSDCQPLKKLLDQDIFISDMALSSDGKVVAAMEPAAHRLLLIELASGTSLRSIPTDDVDAEAVEFVPGASPDAARVAIAGNGGLEVWDAATTTREVHVDVEAPGLAVAPDGAWIATSDGASVTLWDPRSGASKRALKGFDPSGSALARSSDGRWLASGNDDGVVTIWATATAEVLLTFHATDAAITAMAFAPDGSALVVGAHDGAVGLWSLL